MNNKLILQLIKNNIQEIQSLINHFQNEEDDLNGGFPLLESRLASLNKDIEILKLNLNKQDKEPILTPDNQEISEEKPLESINLVSEDITAPTEPEFVEEIKVDNEVKEVEEVPEIKIEYDIKEPIISKDETNTSTLNDKLQSVRGENLQEKIKKSRLEDIQSAIGINDQFLFIRELFDNNTKDYKSEIAYINTQDDYDKIISHFNQSKEWDNEDLTVTQFFSLIKRKFE